MISSFISANISHNVSKDDETIIIQAVGGYGEVIKGVPTQDNPLPPDEVKL